MCECMQNVCLVLAEYQQRTTPLTAREPVPTTSPLYDGTQSTEGVNKQNGSTAAATAYYKKFKADISGEEKYNCKHHQVAQSYEKAI